MRSRVSELKQDEEGVYLGSLCGSRAPGEKGWPHNMATKREKAQGGARALAETM